MIIIMPLRIGNRKISCSGCCSSHHTDDSTHTPTHMSQESISVVICCMDGVAHILILEKFYLKTFRRKAKFLNCNLLLPTECPDRSPPSNVMFFGNHFDTLLLLRDRFTFALERERERNKRPFLTLHQEIAKIK